MTTRRAVSPIVGIYSSFVFVKSASEKGNINLVDVVEVHFIL